MQDLMKLYARAEGEAAWNNELHSLFNVGALDEAEERIASALEAIGTDNAMAWLRLRREAVEIEGWDVLTEAIMMHEGAPVTGVTIALANEVDRAFEKGASHHPFLMFGIYTDEGFAFSRADRDMILDELDKEYPSWAGYEEDIEVHMDIDGLDQINTQLLHHKERHFFRDDAPERAPVRYVEYVLGCWWRALRWHQAVATECAVNGLPGGIPVIAGMVDMKPEPICINQTLRGQAALAHPVPVAMEPETAGIGADFIKRKEVVEEEKPMSGRDLRRMAQAPKQEADEPQPVRQPAVAAQEILLQPAPVQQHAQIAREPLASQPQPQPHPQPRPQPQPQVRPQVEQQPAPQPIQRVREEEQRRQPSVVRRFGRMFGLSK